jgi:hypothetical protein
MAWLVFALAAIAGILDVAGHIALGGTAIKLYALRFGEPDSAGRVT